jgi:hypothetical protein
MDFRFSSLLFPMMTSGGSHSAPINGSATFCFLSVEPRAIFLRHQMGNQSTMIAPRCQMISTSTIIHRVKLLFIFTTCCSLFILVSLELCLFVDYQGLNDNVTSSDRTPRSNTFRANIIARDGVCIVTRHVARHCDAAHLVPRSKGNAVRFPVNPYVSSMTFLSSILIKLPEIVLDSTSHNLQFLILMPSRMESYWKRCCIDDLVQERLPC